MITAENTKNTEIEKLLFEFFAFLCGKNGVEPPSHRNNPNHKERRERRDDRNIDDRKIGEQFIGIFLSSIFLSWLSG